MKNKNPVFGPLFKKYRLRSEIETLSECAKLMADEGMIYAVSLFTRWQNGERVPTDRRAVVTLIKIFVKKGGINSVDAANELLSCLDMRVLSEDEIDDIQNVFKFNNESNHSSSLFKRSSILKFLYKKILSEYESIIIFILFALLTIHFLSIHGDRYLGDFASTYFIVALFGSINSFFISKKLGLFDSSIGKSILMFSFGLFSQVFGQLVYSYYYFNDYWIAYPSLGDIGFFGTIPLYILGVIYLADFFGVKITLQSYLYKLVALILPLGLLILTYIHLLKDYNFMENSIIRIFLDFGYPFGQTVYISIALLALLLSKKVFGSIKRKLQFIIIALICQYIADYFFIYLAHEKKIMPGGLSDYFYMISYFIMSISLMQFKNIRGSNSRKITKKSY